MTDQQDEPRAHLPGPSGTVVGRLAELRARLEARVPASWDAAARARFHKAVETAQAAHDGQQRKGGGPYVQHPLRVALVLLEELDIEDLGLICAALLHDVLEDAGERFAAETLAALFGPDVVQIVEALTAPDAAAVPDKLERNRLKVVKVAQGPPGGRVVKLADRIDNLRDAVGLAQKGERIDFCERYASETAAYYLPLAQELGDDRVMALLTDALGALRRALERRGPGALVDG